MSNFHGKISNSVKNQMSETLHKLQNIYQYLERYFYKIEMSLEGEVPFELNF